MIHLEPTEVLAVLRAAKAKGAREWAMFLVAYKHGMRASEVCNLRVDDLDVKNGNIVVERLKGSLRTTQAVTEHRGEPLLNELKALREWLRQRPEDGSDFLFVSQKGGRLDRSQFFRLFQSIAAAAALPPEKQHPHALKHFYYLSSTTKPEIAFLDFASRRSTKVFAMDNPPAREAPGLGISPDGRTVFYTQLDDLNSDVILVDNFR